MKSSNGTPDDADEELVFTFNISSVEDQQSFHELEHFVHEFAPQYLPIIHKVIRGENVDGREIQKVLETLLNILVPLYRTDGTLEDPTMAHMHNILINVGKQI